MKSLPSNSISLYPFKVFVKREGSPFSVLTIPFPDTDSEEEANRITKLSACWTDDDGFKKTHTFKFGYEYNDEALAYHQGTWSEEHNCYIYITARGNVHVCSAEQADTYRRSRDEREVKYQQAHTRHYGTADNQSVVDVWHADVDPSTAS